MAADCGGIEETLTLPQETRFQEDRRTERAKKVAPSKRLRFVIQKHDATRLHYDFRLELDGVFKSWAVTRGPSLDPADKRLAVEVEDHPLDYGDFEGTIPKGQYGGGTVMLWDRGYWAPEGDAAEAMLSKGELKFVARGRAAAGRLGAGAHARRQVESKRNNWLLIKHRDDCAHEGDDDALLDEDRLGRLRPHDGRDRSRQGQKARSRSCARRKSVKADAVWNSNKRRRGRGAQVKRVAKCRRRAQRKTAPVKKSRPCRTSSSRSSPARGAAAAGAGWAHEVKFDGYRMQLRVEDGDAPLCARARASTGPTKFGEIAKAGEAPARLHRSTARSSRSTTTARRTSRRCRRRCRTARPTT